MRSARTTLTGTASYSRHTGRESSRSSAEYERRMRAAAARRSSASRSETSRPCSETRRMRMSSVRERLLILVIEARPAGAQLACAPAKWGVARDAIAAVEETAASLRIGRITLSHIAFNRADDGSITTSLDFSSKCETNHFQHTLRRFAGERCSNMSRCQRSIRHLELDTIPFSHRSDYLGNRRFTENESTLQPRDIVIRRFTPPRDDLSAALKDSIVSCLEDYPLL